MIWLSVALGAAVGAPARYLVDAAITRKVGWPPWGTFTVNLSGAALLGAVAGLFSRGAIGPTAYWILGIGFCGAYTTFSTFIWELIALTEDRLTRSAIVNLILTLVGGITIAFGTFTLAH